MEYRKEIEAYIEEHKDEMLDDIMTLCRINSEKMAYKEGMPFGEGVDAALPVSYTHLDVYKRQDYRRYNRSFNMRRRNFVNFQNVFKCYSVF